MSDVDIVEVRMRKITTWIVTLAAALTLSACGLAPAERQSIADTAAELGDFTTLLALLEQFELDGVFADDAAGPFTVFAPTDAAFEAFLESMGPRGVDASNGEADDPTLGILLYHVLEGRFTPAQLIADGAATTLSGIQIFPGADGTGWALNQATQDVSVVAGPVQASNGTIYVVDQVILPPTIAEVAILAPDFDVLVAALGAADLVDAVNDRFGAPLTVFAPTDAAFAAALAALDVTAEELLASDGLADILLYHVAAGALLAEDVVAAITGADGSFDLPTLLGPAVTATIQDGGVVLNGDVNVIATDVLASNGVIHVLDFVLLPPDDR